MVKNEKEEENLKNDYEEMYNSNSDFKSFCDKAIARGEASSLDELFKHVIVQEVARSYMKGGYNANRSK